MNRRTLGYICFQAYIQWGSMVRSTHIPTFVIALISFIFLFICKILINDNKKIMRKIRVPLPAELVVVVAGCLASYYMDLERVYKVAIVKKIPQGLPPPVGLNFSVLPDIIGDTISNVGPLLSQEKIFENQKKFSKNF